MSQRRGSRAPNISGMNSGADITGMKPTANNTVSGGSTDTSRVLPVPYNFGGAIRQGVTLVRIAIVVLTLYLKFKLVRWIDRRRDRT